MSFTFCSQATRKATRISIYAWRFFFIFLPYNIYYIKCLSIFFPPSNQNQLKPNWTAGATCNYIALNLCALANCEYISGFKDKYEILFNTPWSMMEGKKYSSNHCTTWIWLLPRYFTFSAEFPTILYVIKLIKCNKFNVIFMHKQHRNILYTCEIDFWLFLISRNISHLLGKMKNVYERKNFLNNKWFWK